MPFRTSGLHLLIDSFDQGSLLLLLLRKIKSAKIKENRLPFKNEKKALDDFKQSTVA